MNLRYRPTSDEAAMSPDHVLLEQWATFSGRQLALRVSTDDAASPDVVTVHVRYGSGQAEVIVRADEQASSEASSSASEVEETPDLVARASLEHKGTAFCSPEQEAKTEHSGEETLDDARNSTEETSSPEAEEQDRAPLAVNAGDEIQAVGTERSEMTACTSSKEQHGQQSPGVAAGEQAANSSPEHTEKSSPSVEEHQITGQGVDTVKETSEQSTSGHEQRDSTSRTLDAQTSKEHDAELPEVGHHADKESTGQTEMSSASGQEHQVSGPQTADALYQEVDEVKMSEQSATSSLEPQNSAPLTANTPEKDAKDVKLVVERHGKESNPSAEVESNRNAANVTSRSCADAVHASETPRSKELRIGRFDLPAVLDDDKLEALLRDKPGLTCLSIEWRLDGRKLDIDIVSRYCPDLVELDLTRFRLDTWSLEQLCVACPKLEVIKMPRKCDDSCVNVLLSRLPKLRSLDLSHTNVTGQFLWTHHDSLEKLSLAGCKSLKIGEIAQSRRSSENAVLVVLWEKVRELDLSSTQMVTADLVRIFSHFRGLERLTLANCVKFEWNTLLQVTLCERLRDLDASHVGEVETSHLFTILNRCPQLERLSVAGCTVRNCYFQTQSQPYQNMNASCLRELNVSKVNGLSSVGLTTILAHSPRLERLLATHLDGIDLTGCLTQVSIAFSLKPTALSIADCRNKQYQYQYQ